MNYLYNGVELPALPEWDKDTCPYAVIYKSNLDSYYTLIASRMPCCVTYSYIIFGIGHNNLSWEDENYFLEFRDFVQQEGMFSERIQNLDDVSFVWANHDINYADDYMSIYDIDGNPSSEPDPLAGTLYLAASEPVPVPQYAATFDLKSFLMGVVDELAGKP